MTDIVFLLILLQENSVDISPNKHYVRIIR